eukprot:TRINITY_DN2824_c0_g1_i6.p2 TRINITY_DN2824_c0_g1~~TRINITY_DN2824_c0_g1_i6.p2  ORF type:complete len:327 (-),score=-13.56 TRINITY_DN2824_c0_g1_i6:426-1406(-)
MPAVRFIQQILVVSGQYYWNRNIEYHLLYNIVVCFMYQMIVVSYLQYWNHNIEYFYLILLSSVLGGGVFCSQCCIALLKQVQQEAVCIKQRNVFGQGVLRSGYIVFYGILEKVQQVQLKALCIKQGNVFGQGVLCSGYSQPYIMVNQKKGFILIQWFIRIIILCKNQLYLYNSSYYDKQIYITIQVFWLEGVIGMYRLFLNLYNGKLESGKLESILCKNQLLYLYDSSQYDKQVEQYIYRFYTYIMVYQNNYSMQKLTFILIQLFLANRYIIIVLCKNQLLYLYDSSQYDKQIDIQKVQFAKDGKVIISIVKSSNQGWEGLGQIRH